MNMKSWLFVILMSISFSLMSQPCGGPNQPPCGPGGGGDVDAPLTGIEYLLGFGALLGVKRILITLKKKPGVK